MYKRLITMVGILVLMQCFISAVQADDKHLTVMFDQGHGQKFLVEKEGDLQLSKLSALFKNEGYIVKAVTGPITDETLKDIKVLVISGAFAPVSPAEIDAIIRFLDAGGSLCSMLHIPQPVAGVMSRLQIFASNGVILEKKHLIKK